MTAPTVEALDEQRVKAMCRSYRTRARALRATAWLRDHGWIIKPARVPEQRGRGDWVVASIHTPDPEQRCLGDICSAEPPPGLAR